MHYGLSPHPAKGPREENGFPFPVFAPTGVCGHLSGHIRGLAKTELVRSIRLESSLDLA
jgi:hypothetical protein